VCAVEGKKEEEKKKKKRTKKGSIPSLFGHQRRQRNHAQRVV
jgi:hypothetical protein